MTTSANYFTEAAIVDSSDVPEVGIFIFNKLENSEDMILSIPVRDGGGAHALAQLLNLSIDSERMQEIHRANQDRDALALAARTLCAAYLQACDRKITDLDFIALARSTLLNDRITDAIARSR